jgi:formamidopyrimidine-DNA glycosylase
LPEGPEIFLSVNYLNERLSGKTISAMRVSHKGRYKSEMSKFWCIQDFKIQKIDAKGKMTWWQLYKLGSEGSREIETIYLVVTYGMTGQWHAISPRSEDPNHSVVRMTFHQPGMPSHLTPTVDDYVFTDQRHMGTVSVLDYKEFHKKLNTLGPDMLRSPPDVEVFAKRLLKNPNKTICEVLMDQSIISGIGNYVKAETLYAARVSPNRIVCDLTPQEFADLRNAAHGVMTASVHFGGASFRNHVNVDNREGDAYQHLQIYGKKKCPEGHIVLRNETRDKRTTHWCSSCQK